MVCSLCNESYFKPAKGRSRGRRINNHLPVVLSCGHTFHKRCANTYFNQNNYQCPSCDSYEDGTYTILFMDLDREDGDAIIDSFNDPVDDLAQDMVNMNLRDKRPEYAVIAKLIQQNDELRRGELAYARDDLKDMRERAERAERELEKMQDKYQDEMDRSDWYKKRVDELELLSDRHRENIAGMQRTLQYRKEVIEEYEEEYGYL